MSFASTSPRSRRGGTGRRGRATRRRRVSPAALGGHADDDHPGRLHHAAGRDADRRRSLIEWCAKFARPGPWRSIRSYQVWCKTTVDDDGEVTLKVAIRVGLFGQMRADARLREMNQNTLTRRCERFGVGTSTRNDRPGGQSAVVVDQAFIRELLPTLPEEEEFGSVEKTKQPAEGEPRPRLFDSAASGLPD